jgi:hypothetical protein
MAAKRSRTFLQGLHTPLHKPSWSRGWWSKHSSFHWAQHPRWPIICDCLILVLLNENYLPSYTLNNMLSVCSRRSNAQNHMPNIELTSIVDQKPFYCHHEGQYIQTHCSSNISYIHLDQSASLKVYAPLEFINILQALKLSTDAVRNSCISSMLWRA